MSSFYTASHSLLREADDERLRHLAAMGDPDAQRALARTSTRANRELTLDDWRGACERWTTARDLMKAPRITQGSEARFWQPPMNLARVNIRGRWLADTQAMEPYGAPQPAWDSHLRFILDVGRQEVIVHSPRPDKDFKMAGDLEVISGIRRWNLGKDSPPWRHGEILPMWAAFQWCDSVFPLRRIG